MSPDAALSPTRPAWAEIDLDAIAHNVRTIAKAVAPARVMPVVKANAYGHGAVHVARAAAEAGADAFAVVCVDEAEELRRAGIEVPVLVLTHTPIEDAERAVRLDVTLTVTSRRMAMALSSFAVDQGKTARVHIKVDTGLHRFGCSPDEARELAAAIRGLPNLEVEGVFTHFIDGADVPRTAKQHDLLAEVTGDLDWIPTRHGANSAGIITTPSSHGEIVRPGIVLYGAYPDAGLYDRLDIRPALALKSRLGRVHAIEADETVGYGAAWRAERPSRIGLAMIGYADGVMRALSNKGTMLVRGHRAPIVGRVSMDVSTLDLTDIPEAEPGDEVVVIGRQGSEEIAVDDVANAVGTINHEIFTGLPARLPRLYLREGRPVALRTLNETREAQFASR